MSSVCPAGMIPLVAIASRSRGRRWLLAATGCGGPPPPTNYTVTVTGTSGAIQHSTQVTLTVQ